MNTVFGPGRFTNARFPAVRAAEKQEWAKSGAALTAWAVLHAMGYAFLIVVMIIVGSKDPVVARPLEDILANNTNALSSSSSTPGIILPIILVAGAAQFVWIWWVKDRFESGNGKDASMFGLERGIWFSGIFFAVQAGFVLCLSMDQRGVAFALEIGAFVCSAFVTIMVASARHQDIQKQRFHWEWFLGSELPYEMYTAAAAWGTFWSGIALGIANHDPLLIVSFASQDKVAITILAVWCGAAAIVYNAWAVSFGISLFNTVVLLFVWIYATSVGNFPMTAMGSIYLCLLNFLYTCFGVHWAFKMSNSIGTPSYTKLAV